jgi:Lar family restriction alleviation protein
MTQLLPCPFCGSDDVELSTGFVGDGHTVENSRRYVECIKCAATSEFGKTDDEAAAAWNRRTPPANASSDPQAVIERGNARVRNALEALREALNPPLILATDDATHIAEWYRERVHRAYYALFDQSPADAKAGGQWQPIETAPKDENTPILVYAPGSGYYVVTWENFDSSTVGWWHVDDNKHGPYALRGESPTHWMPLPSRPAAFEAGGRQ